MDRIRNVLDYVRVYLRKLKKERAALNFYGKFIDKDDLCFDIGANVGNKTETFLRVAGRVVAVDPQPACVFELTRRFRNDSRVVIVKEGVGAEPGEADMYICEDINVLSTMSPKWIQKSRFASNKRVSWNTKEKIPITTLDLLIARYGRPKFCKIDVEGYELSVVQGLTQPLEYLSFEFMKEFLDDAEEVLTVLSRICPFKANYSLYEHYDLVHFAKRWRSGSDTIAELRAMEDPKLWGDIYVRM